MGEAEKWGHNEISSTCGLKGDMETEHLAGSACLVAGGLPSLRQEKCPTRVYSMVERIGLSFSTKLLFTALLSEALVHVLNQQRIPCPAPAHVFVC